MLASNTLFIDFFHSLPFVRNVLYQSVSSDTLSDYLGPENIVKHASPPILDSMPRSVAPNEQFLVELIKEQEQSIGAIEKSIEQLESIIQLLKKNHDKEAHNFTHLKTILEQCSDRSEQLIHDNVEENKSLIEVKDVSKHLKEHQSDVKVLKEKKNGVKIIRGRFKSNVKDQITLSIKNNKSINQQKVSPLSTPRQNSTEDSLKKRKLASSIEQKKQLFESFSQSNPQSPTDKFDLVSRYSNELRSTPPKNELESEYHLYPSEIKHEQRTHYGTLALLDRVLKLQVVDSVTSILQTWCGLYDHFKVVFDSDSNGQENETFNTTIMNQPNLYFINYDSKGNVFGLFQKNPITTPWKWIEDTDQFFFLLFYNNTSLLKKYSLLNGMKGSFMCYENYGCLYSFGFFPNACISINKNNLPSSFGKVESIYDCSPIDFNSNEPIFTKRIVVVQMY
ncbi:hypothetical protein QTN25_001994 [Entamoeba marina]